MWAEDNCDLVFLEQIFYKANFAIGFPMNSPYTRSFSKVMVELEENGLLQLWQRKRWRSCDKCMSGKQPGARVIGLVDLQSAFFVLILGLTLGVVTISAECFWKHKFKK
ncbi:glutamate receptor ionotropic, kainate 2-like [Gigantopelta aegis]|uniref:glutamate receptor ionotropic, kainate 2-like n=1 Tax=Gigantopelta aegis TaxID=1735272 RepID=UPI001B88B3D5|nr:glutamate receptor ionotropic, kainate 2-like [Gigantopelta aegis]